MANFSHIRVVAGCVSVAVLWCCGGGGDQPLNASDLTATALSSTQVQLNWKASTRAAVYVVFRKQGEGAYENIASVTETSFKDTGLTPATSYRYWVRSSDTRGVLSSGLQVSVSTLAPGMTQPTDGGVDGNQPPDAGFRPTGPFTAIISNLPDDSYSNAASVTVKFEVTGTPDSVTLLKDNAVLTVLNAPPFEFAWNTAAEAEKTYSLKAFATKAGVDSQMSGVKTLTLDRTAPKVVAQVPLNNAVNVYLADEISVTFSESVLPTTVNDANVQLKAANTVVQSDKVLSADGVKLVVKPKVLPTLPASMELALGQVADKAGNVAVAPAMKFDAPAWQQMGGALNAQKYVGISESSLAVTKSGEVYAAFFQGVPGGTATLVGTGTVLKWNGSGWIKVGQDLSMTVLLYVPYALSALTEDGKIVVAWNDYTSSNTQLVVRRQSEQGWDALPPIKSTQSGAVGRSLAIDSLNRIVVGWNETASPNPGQVSRSNGDSWTELPKPASTDGRGCQVDTIAIDSSDRPLVGCIVASTDKFFQAHLTKFENGAWSQIGQGTASAYADRNTDSIRIILDKNDVPRFSLRESLFRIGGNITSLLIRRLDGTWKNDAVVSPDSGPEVVSYSISKDIGEGLTVATLYRGGSGGSDRIAVKRQSAGGQFRSVASDLSVGFQAFGVVSVRVDPLNNPIVMYNDVISDVDFLTVKRLNRIP
jgi:Bacterial Ig-like domain